MEKDLKTYYDFAENTYHFLINAYNQGLVANAMGAMAQEICEKYLKHLIEEYIIPQNSQDNFLKTEILRTHNLSKLSKYISSHLPEVKLNRQALNLVNGLYFTTRYPGDESIVVDKEDIGDYIDAVKECKRTVDMYMEEHKVK